MALVITGTPASLSSIQDNLIFTVSETVKTADPVTYENYKFVGDVYIGATLVARLKKVPDPTTSIGIFNIGQVVRNYIATTFNPAANAVLAQRLGDGEFSLSITMKFGEEYAYTLYTDLTIDSARVFFNNYNAKDHTTSLTGLSDKALSNRPSTTPVRCDSIFNFVPYLPSTTTLFPVVVRSYNWANTIVNTLTYNITPTAAYELQLVNLSKAAINASTPGMITDYIKYYTVEFNNNGTIYRFDMKCECVYENFTLHFLNKYGGFESKDFAKVSRKTISIEKKDFGKLPYTVDSSGIVSYKNTNNVYNESRSVFSSQFKEKMILNSDLLTDDEYLWLQELVLSPMVYLEEEGSFFPVVITETNYEPKKVVNDEPNNLTVTLEFGDSLNAQYR
jgi:hypothetical protein